MKYKSEYYAKALLSLIEEHPEKEDVLVESFIKIVKGAGDGAHFGKIINVFERLFFKRKEQEHILIVSAHVLGDKLLEKIKNIFSKETIFEYEIRPDLVAGVRIIINGERMIDVSLRRKLALLFNSVTVNI